MNSLVVYESGRSSCTTQTRRSADENAHETSRDGPRRRHGCGGRTDVGRHGSGRAGGQTDRYFGFAFRLQANWQFQPQSYNLSQFGADMGGCPDGSSAGGPLSMFWMYGNQLSSRVRYGTPCEHRLTYYNNLAAVSAGTWHRVVIRAKWASTPTGVYQIWYDGRSILRKTGLATAPSTTKSIRWSVGLYANGWYDDKKMVGTQGTREVHIDHARVASTYAEADPAQW